MHPLDRFLVLLLALSIPVTVGCDDPASSTPDAAVVIADGGPADADSPGSDTPCSDPSACRADVSISITASHECAIRDGAMYCWGEGGAALGLPGVPEPIVTPLRVGDDTSWELIAAGSDHTCGARGGAVFCWGGNGAGQLGDGTETPRELPTPAVEAGAQTGWTDLAAGTAVTCGIRSGELYCWGVDEFATFPEVVTHASPRRVGTDADWTDVAAGSRTMCGVRAGRLFCWSENTSGTAGQGSWDPVPLPTQVGEADDWDAVQGGWLTFCGLRAGALYCWGLNQRGQAGQPDGAPVLVPTRVGDAVGWTEVDMAINYACGIRAGGMYCWGDAGAEAEPHVPLRVGASSDWTEVATGISHTCGIRGGEVVCFFPRTPPVVESAPLVFPE